MGHSILTTEIQNVLCLIVRVWFWILCKQSFSFKFRYLFSYLRGLVTFHYCLGIILHLYGLINEIWGYVIGMRLNNTIQKSHPLLLSLLLYICGDINMEMNWEKCFWPTLVSSLRPASLFAGTALLILHLSCIRLRITVAFLEVQWLMAQSYLDALHQGQLNERGKIQGDFQWQTNARRKG